MPRLKEPMKKSLTYAGKCVRPCVVIMALLIIIGLLSVSGCLPSSVIYVAGDDRIALLDVNEPAPFAGVLITGGRHEELLDYEDKVESYNE